MFHSIAGLRERGLLYDESGFVTSEDGVRLFFGLRGAGPAESTLVLCDGLGCDGFAWRYLQPYFAAKRRTIHLHHRGHGRSGPSEPRTMTVPQLAADALRVLDHLGVERGVFVGHSLGTQVALEVYRAAPERVAGLVLTCGSHGRITETFHGTRVLAMVVPKLVEHLERHRTMVRALWGRVPAKVAFRLAVAGGELDGATIQEADFVPYWEHIGTLDPEVFFHLLHNGGEHSAEDLLARIATPTLVIAAERDTFTPAELAKSMADAIPGAEHFLVRGASHAAPVEQPEAFALRIEKFLLERVESPTRDSVSPPPAS